jgi:hypothetical protein
MKRRLLGAADVLLAAEAVPFSFEREIRVRDAFALEHRDHRLRVRRRDDLVVEPLQQKQRSFELIDEVDR